MKINRYLMILLGALMASPLLADDSVIGYVKTVTPPAYLINKQQQEAAQLGSPVRVGTRIKTEPDGALGLALKDNTLLSFGPDTEFDLSEFAYSPTTDKLALHMRLLRGTLHYISGIIAKLKPAAVNVTTPTGIIGVRGTRFVLKVDD